MSHRKSGDPGSRHYQSRLSSPATTLLLVLLACAPAQGSEESSGGADQQPESAAEAKEKAEEKLEEVTPTDAQQRELEASEDPLKAEQQERKVERAEEATKPESERSIEAEAKDRTGFDLYGSLRWRYRAQGDIQEWQDGGSRAGVMLDWQFTESTYAYARYEGGFNLLTGLNDLTNAGDRTEEFEDTLFTRLWYAGIESPAVSAIYGKNWSTYYQVAGFTDRFQGTGGSAGGAFNAQTDGGPTGPGRADDTLQTQTLIDFLPQTHFKPFKLNFQAQYNNEIPFGEGARYDVAYGLSAILETHSNLTIGLAYNQARVDLKKEPGLRRIGINGDARAALLGVRSFGDRWYAGLVVSRLVNHDTTDDGIYFDGTGSEFYGQYQLMDRIWLVGGYNWLEPDKDQKLARDYRIRYGVLGLRYTFDDFTHMIWANVRFDDSVNADGTPGANVYTVGFRWDLKKRGWHRSN